MSLTQSPVPTTRPIVRATARTGATLARWTRATGAAVRRGCAGSRRLASEVGQGTVEYVGLLLLMATVLAAIVGAAKTLGGNDQIGKKVVNQIGRSIDKAGEGSR